LIFVDPTVERKITSEECNAQLDNQLAALLKKSRQPTEQEDMART